GIPRSAYNSDRIMLDLMPFVNDAIGFRMESERILYYSIHCFGTVDAIGFNDRDKVLRIHDFKSGLTPSKMDQLMIYAALFCLEYKKDPFDFMTELRIYQNGEVVYIVAEPTEIQAIMGLIKSRTETLNRYYEREFVR
ncbi:MAG: hypothetical protein ACNA7U_03855, partial [Candidatus Izemoplasmataceae bacterium]